MHLRACLNVANPSENQSVYRYIKECGVNANLDCDDHVFITGVYASQCQSGLDSSTDHAGDSDELFERRSLKNILMPDPPDHKKANLK